MIDSRSWPSCPCCPSQLLSYTPPEQTLRSGLWPSHVLVEKQSVARVGMAKLRCGQVPGGFPGQGGLPGGRRSQRAGNV